MQHKLFVVLISIYYLCIQTYKNFSFIDVPRFTTEELNTSLLTQKELAAEDLDSREGLKNSTKSLFVDNGSLPPRCQYNFRNRVVVEYAKFYDDKVKIGKCKPLKSLQKSSFCKIANCPRYNMGELHVSLSTPKELTKEEIQLTCELENNTKVMSNGNSSLPPKHQSCFRDSMEYTMLCDDNDGVKEFRPRKTLQRKSRIRKLVEVPKFNNEGLHTSKELMGQEKCLTDYLENSKKILSTRGLPPKCQYNLRDNVSVDYSMFYNPKDEVREPKPQNSLQNQSIYSKIQPKGARYTCSECGKIYSSKPGLLKHQKIHTGISIYVCSKCDKCFTQRCHLKRHESSHAVEKPWVCSYCGKGFTESSSLHKHQRIHTGLKPFVCTECGKTFSISTYLIVHLRTHTGEKPYVCGDCGKCFTQSSSLITHQRIHTGMKPYSCVECGKGFTTSSHLITHQRNHTGERPYHCGECGMSFKHSTHLVLHKRKHTGERPYSCTKCPRTFAQRPQLLKHTKMSCI